MQAGDVGSGFQVTGVSPGQRPLAFHRIKTKKVHWPVALFLIALIVPWVFFFGTLRMSVYRIVLLMMIIPCLGMWMAGKAGRIRTPDIALLLYVVWSTLSLAHIHGWETSIQPSGIIFIETVGPYLLARCYVRDSSDFHNIIQFLFIINILLLPFAILEFFYGMNISREIFAAILPTFTDTMPQRLGFTRVQSVFDHPILFGVFTGSIFALAYLVLGYKKPIFFRLYATGIIAITTVLSVSSGPLVTLVVQSLLLCWNTVFRMIRSRWKILIGLILFITVTIEIVANRSALDIVVGYFLFDPGSYWFRKLIWMYGTASVSNNLLFGTGLNEWEHPAWMAPSIDNFWLFQAVQCGLPAALLMLLALLSIIWAVSLKRGLDARQAEYRTGFLIAMIAFFVVAWTVHLWGAADVLFTFLMGSGVWLLDVRSGDTCRGGAECSNQSQGHPRSAGGMPRSPSIGNR
jgi:hypothetical protein